MNPRRRQDRWDDEPNDRPRVLLECRPSMSPWVVADSIERGGFAVRICEGPDCTGHCDMLRSGACELVAGADVVVNMLEPNGASDQRVLPAVLGLRRPPAVIVEARPEAAIGDAAADPHVQVVRRPVRRQELLAAIATALGPE